MIHVATYNVHSLTDSSGWPNFDLVKRIIWENAVDLGYLHEAGKVGTAYLAKDPDAQIVYSSIAQQLAR